MTAEVFQQALGQPRPLRMARRAVRRLAVPDRRPTRSPTGRKRAARERGTPAPEAGEEPEPALERDRGAGAALPAGARAAGGPASRDRDALHGGEVDPRDRSGAGAQRGRREAAPVPGRAEPSREHGSSQWLSRTGRPIRRDRGDDPRPPGGGRSVPAEPELAALWRLAVDLVDLPERGLPGTPSGRS